ncbi:MAG TPA: HAD hydrolase family protein [Thermoanaerobaculia bacterium]|jgi:3-deoxy-D-manno-octulosonate 8-phosphate phosphatase (KDO 8-P phosphatase)|nr:HAD hydrolase family protein [Thermoanaerobaculia bacterium]
MARSPKRTQRRIRALFCDVDGVLTDGRITLDGRGHEFKVFNTKDGHGLRKAAAAGITVCWISGRTSPATARRARELGVRFCYQGVKDKRTRLEAVRRRLGVPAAETAAIGDDEPDIPMFEAAALSACPSDAAPAARRAATIVLKAVGGAGAVREFIELILERNGQAGPLTHRSG